MGRVLKTRGVGSGDVVGLGELAVDVLRVAEADGEELVERLRFIVVHGGIVVLHLGERALDAGQQEQRGALQRLFVLARCEHPERR